MVGSLAKNALTNIAVSLARENLPGLVSNLTSSAINKFDRKISGKGAVRTGEGFTLFISNEDINDIVKIIKSLEDSDVLIDGDTETVNRETEKQEVGFLGSLLAPLAAELEELEEDIWLKIFSFAPSFKQYRDY